jgi:hypothetical protein
MTAKLTARDRKLLVKCSLCRWLTTTHLRRLYFPAVSLSAVQKRLRKLADAGYLRAHREHPTAEIIHTLGPKGKPLVEELGITASLSGEVPKQVEHLLGINEVRVGVETCGIGVRYFFASWQLGDLNWSHPVIPDAVFALAHDEKKSFVLEYDRGTETLEVLLRKLEFYERGVEGLAIDAVLIVTATDRRIDLLAREMKDRVLRLKTLAAPLEAISRDLTSALFKNLVTGKEERLLEPYSSP